MKSKHDISAYTDDIYLQDEIKENCNKSIRYCNTIKVFGTYRSCRKIPTQELDVLGFTINSVNMTFSLKKEKKEQLACIKKKQ